jgi:hypothetical protein
MNFKIFTAKARRRKDFAKGKLFVPLRFLGAFAPWRWIFPSFNQPPTFAQSPCARRFTRAARVFDNRPRFSDFSPCPPSSAARALPPSPF